MFLIEVTKVARTDDVHVECDSKDDALIFIGQEAFRQDGYRLIEFQEYTGLDDFVLPVEPGATFVLRSSGIDGTTTERNFSTAAIARANINVLHPSDGYMVFASWDGDGGAKRLEQRPRLWRVEDEMGEEMTSAFGREVAMRINEHGRTDTDRF